MLLSNTLMYKGLQSGAFRVRVRGDGDHPEENAPGRILGHDGGSRPAASAGEPKSSRQRPKEVSTRFVPKSGISRKTAEGPEGEARYAHLPGCGRKPHPAKAPPGISAWMVVGDDPWCRFRKATTIPDNS